MMFSFAMVLIRVHLSREEQAKFKWSFKLEKVLLTQLSNHFVDRTEECLKIFLICLDKEKQEDG